MSPLLRIQYIGFVSLWAFFTASISGEPSQVLEKIRKTKTLTVSVNEFYDPFYIESPNPNFPGLDVELAQEYAKFFRCRFKNHST